jgi:hypothetical protein
LYFFGRRFWKNLKILLKFFKNPFKIAFKIQKKSIPKTYWFFFADDNWYGENDQRCNNDLGPHMDQQDNAGGDKSPSSKKRDPRRDPRMNRDPRPSKPDAASELEKEKRMLEVDLSIFGDLELPGDKEDTPDEADQDPSGNFIDFLGIFRRY